MGSACAKEQLTKQASQAQTSDTTQTQNFSKIGEAPLKELAAAKGLIYGAAARRMELKDKSFAASFIQDCGIITPSWEFRRRMLNPSPDSFNFTPADSMVQWAKAHSMLLRGHTLVYQKSMPQWFSQQVNRQNVERLLVQYIETVVGRYAGQMHSWDVVNETIFPQGGGLYRMQNIDWLQWLGLDFYDLVFRATAAADPNALLVFNEDWLEPDTEEGEAKRVAVLKVLEKLKSQGTPIDALGIQSHLWLKDQKPLNQQKIRNFLSEVASLGLKIMITELDVQDRHLPQDITTRDRIVAQAYEDYLSVVLDEPAVIAVITWGLSDRYTWLVHPKRRANEDFAPRPLPLDDNFQRKPAWYAIASAFDHAPERPVNR